ncbi:MAG: NADH-quinone oxidoreductase subunit C [Candidatus Thalassarchaeaceae archaeon]|jgi:NADH:ubiquinone oxidoreductase subunit C|nr:NADH-quinone oxidoreductase subunit C [Candidatus Thalassarchaeaceae archaeon]
MGKKVSPAAQQKAANSLASAISKIDGVSAEVDTRSSGTQERHTVTSTCTPASWRGLAEVLASKHNVDYCSMITGIHWPDASDKTWEVIYHLLRTGVTDPDVLDGVVQPNITAAGSLEGGDVPLEIQISIALPDTRTPSVDSVQDIWVGADWNEKETWDLVGIDFDGHQGMRRVLNPHETPVGYHPLQKQHKLRYHGHEEMYDDVQGFRRKPADAGKVK